MGTEVIAARLDRFSGYGNTKAFMSHPERKNEYTAADKKEKCFTLNSTASNKDDFHHKLHPV
jgi:hypothetical protein